MTTTNTDQIAAWHADKPEWTAKFTARDWDTAELIAERLDMEAAPIALLCPLPAEGRYCTIAAGHDGPCAEWPL